MLRRSIRKAVAVLATALIGLTALAAVGIVGYFVYHLVVPEKMDITGRVTDSSGRPLRGVEVRAVPLPLDDPYSDSAKEPQESEQVAVSGEDGRYRFEGLVASVGVKEGRCMQGYDITARYRGRSSPAIHVCKHPDDRRSTIKLDDLVIPEQPAHLAAGEES